MLNRVADRYGVNMVPTLSETSETSVFSVVDDSDLLSMDSVRTLTEALDDEVIPPTDNAPSEKIPKLIDACSCCGKTDWWAGRFGNKICNTCHPKSVQQLEAR